MKSKYDAGPSQFLKLWTLKIPSLTMINDESTIFVKNLQKSSFEAI